MGFGLWLSSVNFGASCFSDVEQLVSPDHHFLHLKGVAVICNFMVMSQHILAIVALPFQLSLCPKAAFAQSTGSLYSLLVPLVGSFMGTSSVSEHETHSLEAVSMSELSTFSLDEEAWSLVSLSSLPPSHLLDQWWPWLDWRGTDRFLPHCSELVPVSSISLDLSSSPCAELCSPLVLTSWVLTWVLLLLLREWSCFSVWRWLRTHQMGTQLGECLPRGYLVRKVLQEVEFWVDELDCLRGLELVGPQIQMQQGHPQPVVWQWSSFHSYTRRYYCRNALRQ